MLSGIPRAKASLASSVVSGRRSSRNRDLARAVCRLRSGGAQRRNRRISGLSLISCTDSVKYQSPPLLTPGEELWWLDHLYWLRGISVPKQAGKELCGKPCPLCG